MRSIIVVAGSIVVSIVFAACATTAAKSPSQLQEQNLAIVKGYEVPFLKDILSPIGTKTNVKIQFVDGEKKWNVWSGYADQVEVTGGKHSLTLLCYGEFDRIPFQYQADLTLEAQAGKTYQLQPQGYVGGCKVAIEEIVEKR